MRIHNLRLGFACNSSSTHSLIFLPPNRAHDRLENDPGQYGWEFFTLASPGAKLDYLATLLYEQFEHPLGSEKARQAVIELLGQIPGDPEDYLYVDHQSRMTFPRDLGDSGVSRAFLEEVREFFLRPDLVILGGNDNASHSHPLAEAAGHRNFILPFADEFVSNEHLVCRKDFGHWVLYNQLSGAKIRFSFAGLGPETVQEQSEPYRRARPNGLSDPLKAETPELVDVKLTDFCPYGCPMCAPPGTSIMTPHGEVAIETLREGKEVMATSPELEETTPQVVEEVYVRNYEGELVEIELEDGRTLSLTPNHPVYTRNRGWVDAGDLMESDDLVLEHECKKAFQVS